MIYVYESVYVSCDKVTDSDLKERIWQSELKRGHTLIYYKIKNENIRACMNRIKTII